MLLFFYQRGFAQATQAPTISAQIVDSTSSAALASSTIQVFREGDKSVFRSVVADSSGRFSVGINAGTYYLSVKHLGYTTYTTRSFELTPVQSIDLGIIRLQSVSKTLEEVVVQAQKSSMQLSLDKKVFNVGQDLANAGGSATDILSNIPSVAVDQEGNVKLRGSDNVRILIDGKPSGLVSIKGGSGLQQLQASMVDKVEIITNPSARYEAEGVGGVINIILKKEKQQGFNGSIEAVAGTPTNLGAAANFNYRHKRFNFFINYGINYRV